MIGMNQIKKRLIHGILIGLGVGILGIIITLLITNNIIRGYEEGTSEKFNQQYMTKVYTLSRDTIQGEKITSDMLRLVDIPKTTMPLGAELDAKKLVGKIVRYNIPRNIVLLSSMVSNNIVGVDIRKQELNCIVLPSDLAEGEYIDVRLVLPNGVDYIVLAQKQVIDIENDTIQLNLSEEEILLLDSAIVDSYLTAGSKLYAIKYSDPEVQIKVSTEEIDEARTYIAEKLAEELIARGAIAENTTEKVETIVDSVVNQITNATGDGSVLNVATGETEVKVPADKYIFSVSTLKADELIGLISKYAIEYRYYIQSLDKIEANYQPNSYVMSYMKSNEYVLETAKQRLNSDIRNGMEAGLITFEMTKTEEQYERLMEKVQESIDNQKALRSQALAPQQSTQPVQ